jgi:uncharacterized membrane protein
MIEEVIVTLLGLLVLALFLGAFVLPIIALVRTSRINELRERLDHLERELIQLRSGREPPTAVTETVQPMQPGVAEREILDVLPAPGLQTPRRRPRPPELDSATLEEWIGKKGLGWTAVVVLLFATAFFLKYAFENDWIGPTGRVSMGLAAGAGLCVAGWRYRRDLRLFSQMLTAAGVVLLYLATFGSFAFYHLMPREQAGFFLVIIVAETAALAILYEAPAIALMAVIGGLLTPLLMHTDHDQYRALFVYLAALDAGVVALILFRRWWAIATVALLGTQGIFWLWYGEHYHPEKLAAALCFQGIVFGLFLTLDLIASVVRRRSANVEDLLRVLANIGLFGTAGYVLLDPDYHVWMGLLTIDMAILFTALGWLLFRRRPDDPRHLFVYLATSFAFLALAIPLQAKAAWIAGGWATEGLALWWFGLRIRTTPLRVLGAILLLIGAYRLVVIDLPWAGRDPFVPIFNKVAPPELAVAICLLAAAVATRRLLARPLPLDLVARYVAGFGGVVLVWLILSLETYQFFTSRIDWRSGLGAEHLTRMAQTSLSALWAVYAVVILALGFWLRHRPLRWAALGLFGLTLGKVFLIDMAGLAGFYRVMAFFVLAVLLGLAAWGYQKVGRSNRAALEEVVEHETVS